MPTVAIRLRRDFRLLLSLVRSHALLHRANRSRTATGAVIATLEDYRQLHDLLADLMAEAVEAVAKLAAAAPEGVTNSQLAAELGLDKGPISRRVRAAQRAGYLKNLE